jgi:hypothetical protein
MKPSQLPESVRQQVRALFRSLYDGLTTIGVCQGCKNRSAVPGKVHCSVCRCKAESRRRDAGMQPRTEKPPAEVSRQAREQRRNKAAGLCRQCSTPSPDRALCERCRAKQKEQRLKRSTIKTP